MSALANRLRADALCATDHPADAVAALMEAATAILCVRFSDDEVVHLLAAALADALADRRPATAH